MRIGPYSYEYDLYAANKTAETILNSTTNLEVWAQHRQLIWEECYISAEQGSLSGKGLKMNGGRVRTVQELLATYELLGEPMSYEEKIGIFFKAEWNRAQRLYNKGIKKGDQDLLAKAYEGFFKAKIIDSLVLYELAGSSGLC